MNFPFSLNPLSSVKNHSLSQEILLSSLPDDLAALKMKRNLVTSLMKRERCNYYSDWVSQNSHDQHKLFRKATTLLGLKNQSPLPSHSNIGALTEEFADFFIMKIDDIRASIDSSSFSLDIPSSNETEASPILSLSSVNYLIKILGILLARYPIQIVSSILYHPR